MKSALLRRTRPLDGRAGIARRTQSAWLPGEVLELDGEQVKVSYTGGAKKGTKYTKYADEDMIRSLVATGSPPPGDVESQSTANPLCEHQQDVAKDHSAGTASQASLDQMKELLLAAQRRESEMAAQLATLASQVALLVQRETVRKQPSVPRHASSRMAHSHLSKRVVYQSEL